MLSGDCGCPSRTARLECALASRNDSRACVQTISPDKPLKKRWMVTHRRVISFIVIMASPGDSTLLQFSRPPKVAFGSFEFDPASGQLRKHGYKVKLPGQPREILNAL